MADRDEARDTVYRRLLVAGVPYSHVEKALDGFEVRWGAHNPPTDPPQQSRHPRSLGKTRRRRRLPEALDLGIKALNRLRDKAAVAIIRRDQAAAARNGMELAPADALRKLSKRDDYALTARHRGATALCHARAFLLREVDGACAEVFDAWAGEAARCRLCASCARGRPFSLAPCGGWSNGTR